MEVGGSTPPVHVDLAGAMRAALADGTASWWQKGPLASQARVTVPISGSFYIQADITAFADGGLKADVHFNNDLAMGATGGAVSYAATVTLDGKAAVQPRLTQYQYQNWNKVVESEPAAFTNVRHDIAHLERTGLVANYDPDRARYSSATISGLTARMARSDWNAPFASNDIYRYMPGTGGRPDIGPTTRANADWLLTQDATAAKYALDQAGAADGIPWHFRDVATGTWLNTTNRPKLWTDPRGGVNGLTQQVDPKNSGWTPQTAHQPDTSYVPYLLTGERTFLDEVNAQAGYVVMSSWPYQRMDGQALVARYQETRGDAWNLRQVQEAARINPDGTAEQAYYTQVTDANWKWLVSMIPTWTEQQGEAYGYIGDTPTILSDRAFAPWQNDYFATTTVAAASQGNEDAKTFLRFQAHWLSGRFLNTDNGFNAHNGTAYFVVPGDVQAGGSRTWAGMQAATVARGYDIGTGWNQADYAEVALTSLAGVITVLGDTREGYDAMRAYGWLVSSDAPYLTSEAQFQIAPRLADGGLLTWSNITVSRAATGTTNTLRGSDAAANQLIHAGDGDDTVVGGSGINLLFAGAGSDRLVGGANADYLFGGTGRTVFQGGAGTNYMHAGKGADTFVLDSGDAARDRIVDFEIGTDLLQVHRGSNASVAASEIQALIGGATQDTEGNTVLHLSAAHAVTLEGISTSRLGAAMFGPSAPVPPTPPLAPAAVTPTPATPAPGLSPAMDIKVPTVVTASGSNTLTLRLSEDAWRGDAQFKLAVDGELFGTPQTVFASHAKGEIQTFIFKGDFGPGQHKIAVTFTNDAYGGTPESDRNLHLQGVDLDGVSYLQKPIFMPYNSAVARVTVGQPTAVVITASESVSAATGGAVSKAAHTEPLPQVAGRPSEAEAEPRAQDAGGDGVVDPDSPTLQAARLYQAAFDRLPDAGGLKFWADALAGGTTLPDVAADFLSSPEFAARYGFPDDVDYVDQLYRNILHRAGDAGGTAFWTGRLDEGASRQVVLVGFSESLENRLLTASTDQILPLLQGLREHQLDFAPARDVAGRRGPRPDAAGPEDRCREGERDEGERDPG